ncbi:uncharacterized protein LOC128683291 [Plodia interpunctella]|uniref:uncharacterized protein LOC128683291 n=1 Tax=Plodia interpunctella TaxID=58824 RepID=UPI002367B32B|nr:uncharacterized protein LOC128683291 [Plodia interpunctella]
MWLWATVWQVGAVVLVAATIDFRFFTQKRFMPSQIDCYDVPAMTSQRFGRSFNDGWRSRKNPSKITMSANIYPQNPLLNKNEFLSRRIDLLFPGGKEIVKEHAKLVQDINSLRQVVFISPLVDESSRDYDDSVFHEMIETSTTPRPSPFPPKLFKSTNIPVILLGGESQNDLIKTQPMKFSKPINLVGTSVSPLLKHPYPFVMQAKSQRPFKFCMHPIPTMYPTTARPSLLQRLINAIIPR